MNVTIDLDELNTLQHERNRYRSWYAAAMRDVRSLHRKVKRLKAERRSLRRMVPEIQKVEGLREVDIVCQRHGPDMLFVEIEDANSGCSLSVGTWTVKPDGEQRLRLHVPESFVNGEQNRVRRDPAATT